MLEVEEYKYLDQSIVSHEEEENGLLNEVAEKDDEIDILKARIDELTNTKMQLCLSQGERSLLFSELVKLNKEVFVKAFKAPGINTLETLSSKDAITTQLLPMNKMCKLRICLTNMRMNILPS